MNRRSYLRSAGAALAAGLASGLAGCSGGDGGGDGNPGAPPPGTGTDGGDGGTGSSPTTTTRDPAPNLAVDGTDFGYESADGGNLRTWAVVENVGDEEGAATLVFVVTVDGEAHERSQFVRLPPEETTRVEATFDVTVEAFENGGSLAFRWQTG